MQFGLVAKLVQTFLDNNIHLTFRELFETSIYPRILTIIIIINFLRFIKFYKL